MIADSASPREAIGFHLQQATEKLLKAALSLSQIPFPRTHQLPALISLLKKNNIDVPEAFGKLQELAPFAVDFRYDMLPDEKMKEDQIDFMAERELVRKLGEWVEEMDK